MTLDKKKKNEWEIFLETQKGGANAVQKRPPSPYKTPRNVSGKQSRAIRRSSNG